MAKNSIIVEYKSIGNVLFQKSARAKSLNISIRPNSGVRIAVPMGASFESAKRFFEKHIDWAQEKINAQVKPEIITAYTIFDKPVNFEAWDKNEVSIAVRGLDNMTLNYPKSVGIENLAVQNAVKRALLNIIKKIAKIELARRIHELSAQYGFQFNEVRVKDIKTRWGSCSIRNNINLSVYLSKAPQELRDYVIIHELVHTKVKNHQKEFWDAMDKIIPNAKKVDKKMRDYHAHI